jgi:hypothetical protein
MATNKLDILLIQEVHAEPVLPAGSFKDYAYRCVFSAAWSDESPRNGVMILYSRKYKEVTVSLASDCLLLLSVAIPGLKRHVTFCSAYLNPTKDAVEIGRVKLLLSNIKNMMCDFSTQDELLILGGDFNQYAAALLKYAKSLGFRTSAGLGPTRRKGKAEIDMIFTNIAEISASSAIDCYPTDHYMIVVEIGPACPRFPDVPIGRTALAKNLEDLPALFEEGAWTSGDYTKVRRLIIEKVMSNIDKYKQAFWITRRMVEKTNLSIDTSLYAKLRSHFATKYAPNIDEAGWKLLTAALTGANSHSLSAIRWDDGRLITNSKEIENTIAVWGKLKWGNTADQVMSNNARIENLRLDYLKPKYELSCGFFRGKTIFDHQTLIDEFLAMPTNTSFGPDMLVPAACKPHDYFKLCEIADRVREKTGKYHYEARRLAARRYGNAGTQIVEYIITIFHSLNYDIPRSLLGARLILLSKEEGPIAPLDRTRPLWIQNLPIRLIEKWIYRDLADCASWSSTKTKVYQTGFQTGISVQVNIARAIGVIHAMRKKPTLMKSKVLVALDLTSAFDCVNRSDVLTVIERLWKDCSRCTRNCPQLWALAAQLLKPSKIYYGNSIDPLFEQCEGVPQGGVLSPLLFALTLDYILLNDVFLKNLVTSGTLIAYADDILLVGTKETIALALSNLYTTFATHGLRFNPKKCEYLADSKIDDIEGIYASHTEQMKYLGKKLSLKKDIMKKCLVQSLKAQAYRLQKIIEHVPISVGKIVALMTKGSFAFHLVPCFLTGEMTETECVTIMRSWIKKVYNLPTAVPSVLLDLMMPMESLPHWLRRVSQAIVLKVHCNKPELNFDTYLINAVTNKKWTRFSLFIMPFEMKRITTPWHDFVTPTSLQANRCWTMWHSNPKTRRFIFWLIENKFPVDSDPNKKTIWYWGALWTPKHRLLCQDCCLQKLRPYTPQFFEKCFTNGGYFNDAFYTPMINEARIGIEKFDVVDGSVDVPIKDPSDEELKIDWSKFPRALNRYNEVEKTTGIPKPTHFGDEWKYFSLIYRDLSRLTEAWAASSDEHIGAKVQRKHSELLLTAKRWQEAVGFDEKEFGVQELPDGTKKIAPQNVPIDKITYDQFIEQAAFSVRDWESLTFADQKRLWVEWHWNDADDSFLNCFGAYRASETYKERHPPQEAAVDDSN